MNMMNYPAWLLLVLAALPIGPAVADEELESVTARVERSSTDRIDFYETRYSLDDIFEKATNNHGEGLEALYGTRNFRTILNGVAYRGGANNKYHREGRRDNMNPLPVEGLVNLCKEGFERSYYLYRTNFETAPKVTHCMSPSGNEHRLDYKQVSPFDDEHARQILGDVYETIHDSERGPVYLHCWNGWHASGLISAYILRQFCGFSDDEAVAYWDANTDGNNKEPRYESIRRRIRQFEPYPELAIEPAEAARICP